MNRDMNADKISCVTYIPNVALPNENPGMVNGLCHSRLKDLGLQPALEEVLNSQSQDIVELILTLLQQPISKHPAKKSLTLKNSLRVLLIKCQELPRSITDPAQRILNPPQLPLAPQSVLPNQLKLRIQPLLLVRTTGLLESLPI
ncbi:hypothetical protein IEQ34_019980 [Dendrobium chrysotoxum]|uniref:Uncharacterized protein n=1 Tax=Dendrobium chrysotoxum TaxID=161865 RepID=A0AAV7G8G1_DENCH|nr:hypothetical protein IEQ34_019980 [Dendrobium chrysotoxum]